MKKQTAVELLIQEFAYKTSEYRYTTDGTDDVTEIVNKALKMEKQQIEDAWVHSAKEDIIEPLEDKFYKWEAEQYYNETYGGQDEQS
jgi:hypothetical protein